MRWIENEHLRVGIDLELGGAITWVSRAGSGELNVINSYDWGRQVQMSFYSGPTPYSPGGKQPHPNWAFIGWNPIQSGDVAGNRSRVLEQSGDGSSLYVKSIPMHWPLDNVPGECTFESWLRLEGDVLKVRARIVNQRTSDTTQYPARDQECPAVYTNGPFYRLITYTGAAPFTNAPVEQIDARLTPNAQGIPEWANWMSTEHWAALVNDEGWGLGLFNREAIRFTGGFAGEPGTGGPKDAPTGYFAPIGPQILDHNIALEYSYDLLLGTVEAIRAHAYARNAAEPDPARPGWSFTDSRQGWFYQQAADTGWPIEGQLEVTARGTDPALVSPFFVAQAEQAPVLRVTAAFTTRETQARVYWRTLEDEDFSPERSLAFEINGDGTEREYRVPLADSPDYRGTITRLRIDLGEQAGNRVTVRKIEFSDK